MKALSFYFKESFIASMYLVMFTLVDLGILCIGDDLIPLKIGLCVVSLLGFMFIVGLMYFKEGEKAMKIRRGNDLNRKQIILTGRDYPLNTVEEYKAWKGFVIGLNTCIPLVISLIVHVFVSPKGPYYNVGGVIAAFLYMIVFAFTRVNSAIDIPQTDYYYTLFAIPVLVLTIGIGYMLGARKAVKDHEKIRAKHRAIHGDDD